MMIQNPTIQLWIEVWHNTDTISFKKLHATDVIIFLEVRPSVIGSNKILEYMRKGLGTALTISSLKKSRCLEAMTHLNISITLAGGGIDVGFVYHKRQ